MHLGQQVLLLPPCISVDAMQGVQSLWADIFREQSPDLTTAAVASMEIQCMC